MAGSFGWQFILFVGIFYMFLAMILGYGANSYLTSTIISPTNYTASNYSTNISTANITTYDYISYLWQNPFSAFGWLVWLSTAFLIAAIYIIVTSLIP